MRRFMGFHSDFIGFYYPHILYLLELGTVTVLTPKHKGELEEIPQEIPWVELGLWRSSRHHGCFNKKIMIDLDDLGVTWLRKLSINGGNGHTGIVFDNGDETPRHIGKGLGELKQTSGRNNWAVLDYFWWIENWFCTWVQLSWKNWYNRRIWTSISSDMYNLYNQKYLWIYIDIFICICVYYIHK